MGLIAFFLLVGARGSFAHSVVIYAGRIVWDESELRIEFDFHAHLIEHERRALGREIGAQELTRFLADSFVVSDETGGRLALTNTELAFDRNGATLTYSARESRSAVAILYRPAGRFAALQRQFQWRFVRKGDDPALVRITPQFNHGVVVRVQGDESEPLSQWRYTPSLRVIPNETDAPLLQIDIPGFLVGDCLGIALDGATIRSGWVEENRAPISDWIGRSLSCADGKGTDLRCAPRSISLLLPDGRLAADSNRSLNVLTTRLRIPVAATNWPADGVAYLTWRGFTHGVLRMAVIDHGNPSRHLPDLTPMQNVLRIDGSNARKMELRVEAAADRPTTHGATDAG